MNLLVLSLEQRLDLWFEYADTYGRQGNTEKALTRFGKRFKNENRFFRGVSQRIEELRG